MSDFATIEEAEARGFIRAEAGVVETYRGAEITLDCVTPPSFGCSRALRASAPGHQSAVFLYSQAVQVGEGFVVLMESAALADAMGRARRWIDDLFAEKTSEALRVRLETGAVAPNSRKARLALGPP